MAGLFDWLLIDPTAAGGGYLARLLGLDAANAVAPGGAAASTAAGGGLLGGSPLGNALRGGFAGLDAAHGRSGFGAQMAAGALGGAQAAQQKRQWALQNTIDAVRLSRAPADIQAPAGPGAGSTKAREAGSAAPGGTDGLPVGKAIAIAAAGGAGSIMVQDASGALRPLDRQNELVVPGPDGTALVFRRTPGFEPAPTLNMGP